MHFSVSMKLTFKQSAFQEVINGKGRGSGIDFHSLYAAFSTALAYFQSLRIRHA